MSKTSQLIKNTVIIGIGTLSTKVLTFLLLPLYTTVLAPDDYGIIDVLITVSSLLIPFATMEMNSGVFRFLIEKSKDSTDSQILRGRSAVVSTCATVEGIGLILTVVASGIVNLFFSIPHYPYFIIYVVSMAIAKLCLDTCRGFGHNTVYSVANFIITLVSLVSNIVLILGLGWPGKSILLASVMGNLSGSLFIVIKEKLWRFVRYKYVSKEEAKPIIKYTLPLIPNTVSWWVVSASDRLIILAFLGATANGIYAAAHKIPGIYTTVFTVFSLAWTESVARNIEDKEFITKTIKKSIHVMVYMLLALMIGTSIFFDFLIGPNYADAYWHIFILLIAVFFSSTSSLYGGIFSGYMDSKVIATTTVSGAILNILINISLVKFIGLYAASISTTIAYIVISFIRKNRIRKWVDLNNFRRKDAFTTILLTVIVIFGYYLRNRIVNICILAVLAIMFCVSYKDIIQNVLSGIKSRRSRRI